MSKPAIHGKQDWLSDMSEFTEEFEKAQEYLRIGHHSKAYECLESIVYSLSASQFSIHSEDLEKLARKFQRKLETNLLTVIEEKRNQVASGRGKNSHSITYDLQQELRKQLANLSDYSIFDWSTSYKKYVAELFDTATSDWKDRTTRPMLLDIVREEFASHTKEIFEKGYKFKSESYSEASKQNYASRGLVSFLDLPFQENIERLNTTRLAITAETNRQLCSSIIAGVIEGFSRCTFGSVTGVSVLQPIEAWKTYVGLLTGTGLKKIEPVINTASMLHKPREHLLPLCESLDRLLSPEENDFYVIRSTRWDNRVQSITVELVFPTLIEATRAIRVVTYLNPELISFGELEQQLNREAAVILAPLTELMIPLVDNHEVLRERVVNTSNTATSQSSEQIDQIVSIVKSYMSNFVSGGDSIAIILRFNYAAEFPLEQSRVSQRFYVDRPSVRQLIPSINSRSGIRLWTSMRRSGKTTSCYRLAGESDAIEVVFQTCQFTDQEEYSNFFYDRVKESLDSERLSKDFLPAFFQDFAAISKSSLKNLVLVIDEYETLFELLELKSRNNRLLQIAVVQPLLNQLVEFAQSNLLVLLGQRPDAHYILMEQNQLSPLVQHEASPLFEHDHSNQANEFCDLLRKVLTFHVPFDLSFADSVFKETHGHPYLTVSLLRDFLAYLIKQANWSLKSILNAEDFERYSINCLTARHLRQSKHYAFFRKMVEGYLSPQTMHSQPWLYAVHDIMNELARQNSEMACSEFDFARIFESRGLSELELNSNELLNNAINGNFLAISQGVVTPRVPLIARIANSVSSN